MSTRTAIIWLSACLIIETVIVTNAYHAGAGRGAVLTLGIMIGLILGLLISNVFVLIHRAVD